MSGRCLRVDKDPEGLCHAGYKDGFLGFRVLGFRVQGGNSTLATIVDGCLIHTRLYEGWREMGTEAGWGRRRNGDQCGSTRTLDVRQDGLLASGSSWYALPRCRCNIPRTPCGSPPCVANGGPAMRLSAHDSPFHIPLHAPAGVPLHSSCTSPLSPLLPAVQTLLNMVPGGCVAAESVNLGIGVLSCSYASYLAWTRGATDLKVWADTPHLLPAACPRCQGACTIAPCQGCQLLLTSECCPMRLTAFCIQTSVP
eukprot:356133-Chlamydomonas_euryale.AAC.8